MKRAPTVYVAISFHGYGHIAQTGPVVNELARSMPGLRLIVQCAAPRRNLAEHIRGDFEHIREPADFGMLMANSLDVRAEASHANYLDLHRDWERHVEHMASRLRALQPSLLLANVPYLPLAAAARAQIPAAGLCSLNWAHIYLPFCGRMAGAAQIYAQMLAAYNSAAVFMRPRPGMDMPGLHHVRDLAPIARLGRRRRAEIDARLGLARGQRLVLLFLGGVHTDIPMARWPRLDRITLIAAGTTPCERPDVIPIGALGMPYIDVLCSSNALITKPGYGSFAEAAGNGVPVLYVRRPFWPEAEFLVPWLARHGRCLEVSRAGLDRGDVQPPLEALWALPAPPAVAPDGASQAVELLLGLLESERRYSV